LGLEGSNFFSLQALLALGHLEFDTLTFCQAAEAVGLNGRVMNKYVLTALALNKTKTFGVSLSVHAAAARSVFACTEKD